MADPELIGYRLVDSGGHVLQSWGGVFGEVPNVPQVIELPSDPPAQVHCPELDGTYLGEWTLKPWMATRPGPSTTPADYQLSKRQISGALIDKAAQLDPDGWVRGLIANIPDALTRAHALNDWENAPFYDRDNALFNDPALLASAGMTSVQIDLIWLYAATLPK